MHPDHFTPARTRLLAAWVAVFIMAALALPATGQPDMAQHRAITGFDQPLELAKPVRTTLDGLIHPIWNAEPRFERPEAIRSFSPRFVELWSQALDRPEVRYRIHALEAIEKAHGKGWPDGKQLTAKLSALATDDPDRRVRITATRVLATVDPLAGTDAFLKIAAEGDVQARPFADEALASQANDQAIAIWTSRVTDPLSPTHTRVSAARSLAAAGATSAIPQMKQLATATDTPITLRLACATSLGTLAADGLVDDARQLAAGGVLQKQFAALMLANHTDTAAVNLLVGLARDASPIVAATAVRSLTVHNPGQVTAIVADLSQPWPARRDSSVRLAAVDAVRKSPLPAGIAAMATWLDAPAQHVRTYTREAMVELFDQQSLKVPVQAVVSQLLDESSDTQWMGLEQACHLAGLIDYEPMASRLVALFAHPRAEVRLAAGGALRRLAHKPTLPDALAAATKLVAVFNSIAQTDVQPASTDSEALAQLLALFADTNYQPAYDLAYALVPKSSPQGATARGAAVYAVGKLKRGTGDKQLARVLLARMNDLSLINPEVPPVRKQSAIAIARIGDTSSANALLRRAKADGDDFQVISAAGWAYAQLTGKPAPVYPTPTVRDAGYFLEPTRERN